MSERQQDDQEQRCPDDEIQFGVVAVQSVHGRLTVLINGRVDRRSDTLAGGLIET